MSSLRAAEGGEAISSLNYYHSDHLGSSNVITDKDGGLAQKLEYTPYGLTARNTFPSPQGGESQGEGGTKYRFTGKELDQSTGLYYYGARYYDPFIGRFIQADTLVVHPNDPQDLNRYAYCRNNPLNLVDPTGHGWFKKFWQTIVGVVTTAISIFGGWGVRP